MKRISYAAMSTLTALVLLFGYRTSLSSKATSGGTVIVGAATPSPATSSVSGAPTPSSTGTTSTATGSSKSTTSSSASAAPSNTGASAKAVTVTGAAADTRWGPVQVQLTVKNGKITNVAVIEYPNNNGRDQEINANALPILISETLKTQTAKIDMVSGATYTSQGYLTSLQSALNQAGL